MNSSILAVPAVLTVVVYAMLGRSWKWLLTIWVAFAAGVVGYALYYGQPISTTVLELAAVATVIAIYGPLVWRKIIAPNILSLLGWGLLGWVLIHPTLLAYLTGLVWQYRWVTDAVFNFAHWTGEPTAANFLIFLGVGICFSIFRNWGNRKVGHLLGGDV